MSDRFYLPLAAATLLSLTLTLVAVDAKPAAKPVKRPAATRPAATQSNAATNAAFNNYLNKIRAKIDRAWYVADGKNHVTLTANIAADGSVTNLNLTSSPSDTKAEQAASDAFNAAQPLDALPGGTQSVKLTLTFDSTADPHGDSSRNIGARVDAITTQTKTETPPSSNAGSN